MIAYESTYPKGCRVCSGCSSGRRKASAKVAPRGMFSCLRDMRSRSNIMEIKLLFALVACKVIQVHDMGPTSGLAEARLT